MSLRIKPLNNRVLVKVDPAVTEIGGIVIPGSLEGKQDQGTVVAVGPGRIAKSALVPMELEVGHRVLLPTYGGIEVKEDGVSYKLLFDADVLAILEEE